MEKLVIGFQFLCCAWQLLCLHFQIWLSRHCLMEVLELLKRLCFFCIYQTLCNICQFIIITNVVSIQFPLFTRSPISLGLYAHVHVLQLIWFFCVGFRIQNHSLDFLHAIHHCKSSVSSCSKKIRKRCW